ncbi:MAG TPA: LptF/LptG family permease, partial [Blastocatellia bacterium]|nr:LptF/LptG family permease [Blastocatellia bacterium]
LGLLLLTAIIFFHEASRFTELLVVASRSGLPMDALWRMIAAIIPGIFVFTLPISLLIGTLVGLGRLSGDSEIISLGASGVSRLRMLAPVIALALAVSCVMLYITLEVLPVSVRNLTNLKADQPLILETLNTQIKPRVFEESIPKKVIYIEDIDRTNNMWHNILLVDLDDDPRNMTIYTASSGSLRQGEREKMPELFLERVSVHRTSDSRGATPAVQDQPQQPEANVAQPEAQGNTPAAGAQGAPERERRRNRAQQPYTMARSQEMTLGIEVTDDKKEGAAGSFEKPPEVEEMTWGELLSYSPPPEGYREWSAEIHKRLSLPAACLVFALLGVGFGISNIRTGRSFGLLLGLAITIVYYLLALTGEHAAAAGRVPIWLGIWLANIVLTAVGVFVIYLQRKPGSDALSALASLRHYWTPAKNGGEESDLQAVTDSSNGRARNSSGAAGEARRRRTGLFSRVPGAQLVDRLILSDMARFFVYILAGFSALFIIITLFQLLNSITRHNIEWTVVANYLIYLLPMIVNYMTPLSALVAVMVTFGILQKTSQLIALKASGQSIFRLAAPALLASLLMSAFIFVNQDYILPFTNRRQNNLRHLIRSGQEPPQTFYQTTNQWIFGVDSRIYNYAHFDVATNSFFQLNVLDLSRDPFSIKRRIYARSASWDSAKREWVLENGWERTFQDDRNTGFEQFKERRIQVAENPEYFKKDPRGSASMTVAELRRKITDLSRSGFDVLDLKIALQSKIAFPLTCLVMVLVGLPFSFSVGKRGALYGVSLGIAIGLAYWGLLGLFEQMGRYEMLPPTLAAWGPNMLFGAGGLYLFLTSRT